jgi:soluble lytic murein transglycosylase-like protein
MQTFLAIGAVGLAAAGFFAARSTSTASAPLPPFLLDSIGPDVIGPLVNPEWQAAAARPENIKYAQALHAAELKHGIPYNMLLRLAWQESRFRQDIITGKVISSAGAIGIMQIVPRWHPTVDPLNAFQAIAYAGKYLRQLYNQFGSWEHALAAYNWGPGNVRDKGMRGAPKETRDYYTEILRDVRASGTVIV